MKQIKFPFSEWTNPAFFHDSILIDSLRINICGSTSTNLQTDEKVSTFSCAKGGANAKRTTYLELLKKIAIFGYKPSSTQLEEMGSIKNNKIQHHENCVAIHYRKTVACENAKLDLVARDRALRSWYGQSNPQKISLPNSQIDPKISNLYTIGKYSLRLNDNDPYFTVGYFGFPKNPEIHPLFYGFGCAAKIESAERKAALSAIERLTQIWNMPIPQMITDFSSKPQQTQDHFLIPSNHYKIAAWLAGSNYNRQSTPLKELIEHNKTQINFFDMTPHEFKKKFFVIKAQYSQSLPLLFGNLDASKNSYAHSELSIHPFA